MNIEFEAFPKIARLNRGMFVTEKIDGTNAAVIITSEGEVGAQSRNRLITPQDDNYGFAGWVVRNAGALAETLGEGRHFGEWWGSGIQRGYGLRGGEKRFSLFNTTRWADVDLGAAVEGLSVVPVLAQKNFSLDVVNQALQGLVDHGSAAAPGFTNPEGVVVFLSAARTFFKVTTANDGIPKSLAERVGGGAR